MADRDCVQPALMDEDAILMQQVAEGDTAALAVLVRRHQQRVLNLAYRHTQDRWLAEDLAQEAFLRVWHSAKRYRPQARFTTWLYRIVVNLCLDEAKRRREIRLTTTPDQADGHPTGGAALEADERAREVREAVARLPERQRIALLLHRFSELSQREIVEITGWSASAVESLLVRAYAGLRGTLGGVANSDEADRRNEHLGSF